MDLSHKIYEIREDLLRRFAGKDVVAAGTQEDHPRFAGENNSVREMSGIHYFRPAEPTVDDALVGKILRQRFPTSDGRGPDEKQGALGRRIGPVHLLHSRN